MENTAAAILAGLGTMLGVAAVVAEQGTEGWGWCELAAQVGCRRGT